jgi:hypothetical protein
MSGEKTQKVDILDDLIPWSEGVPQSGWSFAGYATPEAALQTVVTALTKGEWDLLLTSLTEQGHKNLEEEFKGKPIAEGMAQYPVDFSKAISYRFKKKDISDTQVEFTLALELPHKLGHGMSLTMKRIGLDWKAEF